MEILTGALDSIWRVALVGLLLGAGLPALFAFGMRSLYGQLPTEAAAHDAAADVPTTGPAGRVVAYLCFGIILAATLFGIVVIVFGKQMFA